ncbi:MAG: type-4 uracil-DNA glycosylase [Candidatus Korarchaeum sp.]|nr:type-4 uracil-DNA glycosylase [Candidatus Korarchaeum sp.]MDW8036117.1 type-4 uracil-DNA glycosylase [Candidatus Korarchaeum sp.]
MRLEEIAEKIRRCEKCPLYISRKKAVPGEGSEKARLMFVGEAPGRSEDEMGRPFVGAAGRLLDELLSSIGLKRQDVFITNLVKCRPPDNRDPRFEEIEACLPYLIEQVSVVDPEVLIALGRHSAGVLLGRIGEVSIMRVRGRLHEVEVFGRIRKVMPTLHPAAALYNPKLRSLIEEDFEELRRVMSSRGSGLEGWI